MAEASIPVDLLNPGQVFASLGFLEAADVLCGDAEGGFDWSNESNVQFRLRAAGNENPFGVVLSFLAKAEVRRFVPVGYQDPAKKGGGAPVVWSETFPSREVRADRPPLQLVSAGVSIELGHWADGSTRNDFKLFVGNDFRSADRIALAMLQGTREKPSKRSPEGVLDTRGISSLWSEQRDAMLERPFDVLTPIRGSFNFDPRAGWTAIDVGYSPDEQGHRAHASPGLDLLATLGLEHARPSEYRGGQVSYGAWSGNLPPTLARVVLGGIDAGVPMRRFRFVLAASGKNKVITFAQEEKL